MPFDKNTALVIVDVQNDFADPNGSLYVQDGETIIEDINSVSLLPGLVDSVVVYTMDWHPEKTPHFDKWPVHCVQNTWGANLHPDLAIRENGYIVKKGQADTHGYSGFGENDDDSELLQLLVDHDITRVVLVGLADDYCVKATALDAIELGYEVVVDTNYTKAVNLNASDGIEALVEMAEAGVEVIQPPTEPPDWSENA